MSGRLPNTFKTLNPLIATLNPLITTFYSAWYHQVECAFWFNIALYIALLLAAEDKSVSVCSRVFQQAHKPRTPLISSILHVLGSLVKRM